jgi:tetratricopeptide (TPR) repeat protein
MEEAQPGLKGSARLGSYLRKLRTGYGYSLRRVEERARAEGGEIDNSQLSRYEKGICYPSFDKLRVLASVFNVSIQSFSDVVDLESFEELKPESGDPNVLIEDGWETLRQGDNGKAFALFESALELLSTMAPNAERQELVGKARVLQAMSLRRLGKLSLAEQELRQALRTSDWLSPLLHVRALLTLANIHSDLGDNFLAELEAEKAYRLAQSESLDRMAGMALHTLAKVLHDQGHYAEAIERYREAARIYADTGEHLESIRARVSIGACFSMLGKYREGIRLLRATLADARAGGHRRLESYAWREVGEAYYRQKEFERARSCFRESDALASYNNDKHIDILFCNAYYDWKMALEEDNPTRAKIAFGRMKALRSGLERRLPEADAFDEHVERGRIHG